MHSSARIIGIGAAVAALAFGGTATAIALNQPTHTTNTADSSKLPSSTSHTAPKAPTQGTSTQHQSTTQPAPSTSTHQAPPVNPAPQHPTASPVPQTSTPDSPTMTANPPHYTPVVPGCESGCKTVFTVYLDNGTRLEGLSATKDGAPAGLLAYWYGDQLLGHRGLSAATPQTYDVPTSGMCSSDSECVVSYDTGAHSSAGLALTVDQSGITVTDSKLGDAPGSFVHDFNHDGVPDIAIANSTFQPDYATAPQYWQTLLVRNGKLTSTGCTAPSTKAQPKPTAPLTGHCPTT